MNNITVSIDKLEKLYYLAKEKEWNELNFTYVISSLFPNIAENIKEEMKRQHTLGYIQGYNEGIVDIEKETSK